MSDKLTHVDQEGNPQMVDVSQKTVSQRKAVARCRIWLGSRVLAQLKDGEITTKKGPVFHTAIIAGTMGAKKTPELIPFCHPVGLDNCKIIIKVEGEDAIVECTATVEAKTGVEMEALAGASVAALTIYDMCKALSHDMVIKELRLIEKTGGKSDFNHSDHA